MTAIKRADAARTAPACPQFFSRSHQPYVESVRRRHRNSARSAPGVLGLAWDRCFATYAKVVGANLYDGKTPITAADLLNDRVLPLFDSHEAKSYCVF